MRINYIKYHNYRCFLDATIKFKNVLGRNISLVVGVNGSGKTEILFSFQWVLYGFDFKTMREKEETPYPLNSSLYRKLELDKHSNSQECFVEMSFNDGPISYVVKRSETFFRVSDKIKSSQKISLTYKKENGESVPPITDFKEVEGILTRVIPKSILEGITFDGERMKKLNSQNKQAIETIKGVIAKVTNEELYQLCEGEIKDIIRSISSSIKKIGDIRGKLDVKKLQEEIDDLEDQIINNEIAISGINRNIEETNDKIAKISAELSDYEEAKRLEDKRKGLENDLKEEQKKYNKNIEDFFKDLRDGYTLISDFLLEDIRHSIENVDVPSGLTVEAVKSILKRPKCICGCDMNEDIRKHLTDMLATLPPDNINSTIGEMVRQMEMRKEDVKPVIVRSHNALKDSEKRISDIKKELASISRSMIGSSITKISKLESDRASENQNLGRYKQDKERKTRDKERAQKRLEEVKKEITTASEKEGELQRLEAQEKLLDKFSNAIKRIGEKNSDLSLERINVYLDKAYSLLSEDKGRKIYICQYSDKDKYGLVTYVISKFNDIKILWTNNAYIKTLEQEGLSQSEINERIIIKAKETKSTGQSKTNSLAFAKAILDYSNEPREKESLEINHDYPFLIDSPFTELDAGNLYNSAENLHKFANQIILLVSKVSWEGVSKYIEPYVSIRTDLEKDSIEDITKVIDKEKEE